jgi:hypothetical protein
MGAFLEPEPFGDGSGRDVAHHNLDGDDLDFADELFTHVQALHEMGRDAHFGKPREDVLGDPVVQDALAFDTVLFLLVERGRVVLEMLHEEAGLGALVENFRLALVDAPPPAHGKNPFTPMPLSAG